MPLTPEEEPPSRRSLLRALVAAGALTATVAVTGCSAEQRQALLQVDPRRLRLDEDEPVPQPPAPDPREQRRRAVLTGSLAALAALEAAGDALPPLRGTTGGSATREGAAAVHRAHVEVLSGAPEAGPRPDGGAPSPGDPPPGTASVPPVADPRLPRLPLEEGGPSLPPSSRPRAVLLVGADLAGQASSAERDAADADVPLARLHARVAAARAAQSAALAPADAPDDRWPPTPVGAEVVEALQLLLAREHQAHWSFAVVQAWSGERTEDAATARARHGLAVEQLQRRLRRLGAVPVEALPTYPTDDDGAAVDGPVTAAALALRLVDPVAVATARVLDRAVGHGDAGWVAAATSRLADAERGRWSWGGTPAPWPGSP